MKRCLSIFFCGIILTWGLGTAAQLEQPIFRTIGVNEGLSQSSVYALHQDRFGFIWAGTADGLNRYDGQQVKVYRVMDRRLNSQPNYIRQKLCEDSLGNIWFANQAGVHCYLRSRDSIATIKSFGTKDYQRSDFAVVCLHNQELWVVGYHLGLFSLNIDTKRWQSFSDTLFKRPDARYAFRTSFDGSKQTIYFALYREGGLYTFHLPTKRFSRMFDPLWAKQIFIGKKHFYLSSLDGKIWQQDTSTGCLTQLKFVAEKSSIIDLAEDENGCLWLIDAVRGLVCYKLNSGKAYVYSHDASNPQSLPMNICRTLLMDRHRHLWLGTDGAGMTTVDLRPPAFKIFPAHPGQFQQLKDQFVKCMLEQRNTEELWIGTHASGLLRYNRHTKTLAQFRSLGSVNLTSVGVLASEQSQRMWVGHAFGFSLLDSAGRLIQTLEPPPNVPHFDEEIYAYDLAQISPQHWVGATSGGLVDLTFQKGQWKMQTHYGKPYLSNVTTGVCWVNNQLWLSTTSIGLVSLLRQGGEWRVGQRFFTGMNLRRVQADERQPGWLWVSTVKGLIHFETASHRYQLLGADQGLSNSYCYGVLQDNGGHLWVSTNGGLFCRNPSTGQFSRYTVDHGLQSNEFNTGAFHKGASGQLYFGGIKGLNWFAGSPATITTTTTPMALTGVELNGKALPATIVQNHDEQAFSHQENNFVFQLAVLNFGGPAEQDFLFRLKGWEQNFSQHPASQTLRYSNLPPGNYVLQVKAAEGQPMVQWAFRVVAPWYQTTVFYLLLAIGLLIFATALTRYLTKRRLQAQLRQLEQQNALNEERNRISKDMHDEIGGGLSHIALLSEMVQQKHQAHHQPEKEMATISTEARRLVQSMSEIVWALNPQHDNLEGLLAYLREQASAIFESFPHELMIDFPEKLALNPVLTNEQRRNLFLATKEALNNVLKHAGASRVCLSASVAQSISISVEDNGKGLPARPAKIGSNGLRIMQRRMEDIGGYCELISASKGTTVLLVCPLPPTAHSS